MYIYMHVDIGEVKLGYICAYIDIQCIVRLPDSLYPQMPVVSLSSSSLSGSQVAAAFASDLSLA